MGSTQFQECLVWGLDQDWFDPDGNMPPDVGSSHPSESRGPSGFMWVELERVWPFIGDVLQNNKIYIDVHVGNYMPFTI